MDNFARACYVLFLFFLIMFVLVMYGTYEQLKTYNALMEECRCNELIDLIAGRKVNLGWIEYVWNASINYTNSTNHTSSSSIIQTSAP